MVNLVKGGVIELNNDGYYKCNLILEINYPEKNRFKVLYVC